MKKSLTIFIALTLISCSGKKDNPSPPTVSNSDCGYHNGKPLHLGPQGGCYYLSSGGNKEYVNRAECTCTLN